MTPTNDRVLIVGRQVHLIPLVLSVAKKGRSLGSRKFIDGSNPPGPFPETGGEVVVIIRCRRRRWNVMRVPAEWVPKLNLCAHRSNPNQWIRHIHCRWCQWTAPWGDWGRGMAPLPRGIVWSTVFPPSVRNPRAEHTRGRNDFWGMSFWSCCLSSLGTAFLRKFVQFPWAWA